MENLIFIIPYFGKFNNYFQLFLDSCAENKNINWLILTDDISQYEYPENIKIQYMSFENLKQRFQEKFEFQISLEKPYKLCDYRPAYGYIFENEIKNYSYWGYCDTDIIFGDINKFLNKIYKKNYSKIFFLGHCSIYKNSKKNNRIFMKNLNNNNERYKKVFMKKENCSFDEEFKESINSIYNFYGEKVLYEEFEANIYMKNSNFNLVKYDFFNSKYLKIKLKNNVFIYNKGKLKSYFFKDGFLQEKEYLYIHLQSRKMKVKIKNDERKLYKIIPNSFDYLEIPMEELHIQSLFNKIKKKEITFHSFKLKLNNFKIKLKRKKEKWKLF